MPNTCEGVPEEVGVMAGYCAAIVNNVSDVEAVLWRCRSCKWFRPNGEHVCGDWRKAEKP